MTPRPICWRRSEIQFATQVDVGGLEVGDPIADSVFLAIHQPVPIGRLRKAGDERTVAVVSEDDVLADFTRDLTSSEPHLLFVTGRAGTGKSHLVRWLRSRIGDRPSWHIIYVEKRNTSLRRIIERILEGIDTARARELRETLAHVESELGSVDEAMLALLQKLEQLVRFDTATSVRDLSGPTLADLREQVGRLVGDYTFREQLSRRGGPIERITRLAMSGGDPEADVDERALHLAAEDLAVEPEDFLDTGQAMQALVKRVVSNAALRRDMAMLLDFYLARAKAEVFTGRTTNLLDVFEDVRREVAARGQELCLFIEDLVLLHGIDTELAQALTIPARSDLCRIRAAIAVTSGYLRDVTTFAERGVHYSMNVERDAVDTDALRGFVARYFNAGRVGAAALSEARAAGIGVVNACTSCEYRPQCHAAFGTSLDGHGLYPFNEAALDRVIGLASPKGFDPRTILREAIRGPLEVAEDELPQPARFPSERFAASLDPHRSEVRVEDRQAIANASANPAQELSVRAFYTWTPPVLDESARSAATYFGLHLSDVDLGQVPGNGPHPKPEPNPATTPIDDWVTGTRLPAAIARDIRNWLLETIATRLQSGPFGVSVRKTGKTGEWQAGRAFLRAGAIQIENAGGGGGVDEVVKLSFDPTDADAVILKGVLAMTSDDSLSGPDHGHWYFALCRKLADFESRFLDTARSTIDSDAPGALAILGIQRHLAGSDEKDPSAALSAMLLPASQKDLHPEAIAFGVDTKTARDRALKVLRDQCTQSKGGGAPSVLDAGTLLKDLRHATRTLQLVEPFTGSEELVLAMRSVSQRQARAAQVIWTEVRALVEQIRDLVPPEEDLVTAMEAMDKLIDAAHARGRLPSQDSRTLYLERRRAVDSESIGRYRLLSGRVDEPIEGRSLWDVVIDPIPSLKTLQSYCTLAVQLLHALEADLENLDHGPRAGDRERLDSAFRSLADRLDALEKAG